MDNEKIKEGALKWINDEDFYNGAPMPSELAFIKSAVESYKPPCSKCGGTGRLCGVDGKGQCSCTSFDIRFYELIGEGLHEADKAMIKHPQPNYVITKFSEESGEVVKAAVHCAEGRESMDEVKKEMRQVIAMMYRLWIEGDQVHGLPPVGGQ